MAAFKEGDRVCIVERTPTAADTKSGLYYGYYRGLIGTIFKIYGNGDTAQAAIEIDPDSLPEDVSRRHLETRDRMLDSLTGEAKRASVPGAENEFRLRYVILVAIADLIRKSPAPRGNRTNSVNGRLKVA